MTPTPLILNNNLLSPAVLSQKTPSSPHDNAQESTTSFHSTSSPLLYRIPHQPKVFNYSVSTFMDIPRRLARPPSVQSIPNKWSWSICPELQVSLEDILEMRHISPLSLKDFEQYLLFEEYAAENLYFVLWLKDYTTRFNTGVPALQLSHSIARAKATFFSSDSQYELNLPAIRIAEFYAAVGSEHPTISPASPTFPKSVGTASDPSAFQAIREDVEGMLRVSAQRFARSRRDNANSQRLFCMAIGSLQLITVAPIPLILSIVAHGGRWARFGMLPPIWFGLTVVISSLNGICLLIYLLGGSRQMYPFELIRPPISAPLPHSKLPYESSFTTVEGEPKSPQQCVYPPSPSEASLTSPGLANNGPYKVDLRRVEDPEASSYSLPHLGPSSAAEASVEFETAGFIPVQDTESIADTLTSDPDSHASNPPGSPCFRGSKVFFDFDALPLKKLDSTSGPSALQAAQHVERRGMLGKIYGPLTQIQSSVISRAQWEIVIRSMIVSTFVTVILVGVLVAIPM